MKNNTSIILLGPPGSGKGTQARLLAKKLGMAYFGTGEMMRYEAEHQTPMGKIFQAVWDRGKGELVSDDIVEQFVGQKIKDIGLEKEIIFDGYPRTILQAEHLEKNIEEIGHKLLVLNIIVSDASLIGRMESRRVCQNCGKVFFQADALGIKACNDCGSKLVHRQEDREDILRKRLLIYKKETEPLVNHFEKKGNLIKINGELPIDQVTEEILAKINEGN